MKLTIATSILVAQTTTPVVVSDRWWSSPSTLLDGDSFSVIDGANKHWRTWGNTILTGRFDRLLKKQQGRSHSIVSPGQPTTDDLEECDPSLADIGILSCGGLVEYNCAINEESSLGGFCMPAADETIINEEEGRRLQQNNESAVEYFCGSGSSNLPQDITCDCSSVDVATGTGSFECLSFGYCFPTCLVGDGLCVNVTYSFEVTDFQYDTIGVCLDFKSTEEHTYCVQYTNYVSAESYFGSDFANLTLRTQCTATLDGQECACDANFYVNNGYALAYFDCSSFDGPVGGNNGTHIFFPVVEACVNGVTNGTTTTSAPSAGGGETASPAGGPMTESPVAPTAMTTPPVAEPSREPGGSTTVPPTSGTTTNAKNGLWAATALAMVTIWMSSNLF